MKPWTDPELRQLLKDYVEVAGREVIHHIEQLAAPLKGARVVHVNSTREGGGVAEILHKLIPFKRALGIDARWEIITGKNYARKVFTMPCRGCR